jgi:AraC-like DNA-binding protein
MECRNQPLSDGESSKIWRADDLGDVELLDARYISYSFAKHTHEGAAIGVIEEGAESFVYRGTNHIAPAGRIVVFNPNEAHNGQGFDKTGWRFRMFYLDAGLLQQAVSEMTEQHRDIPFFSSPTLHDPSLAGMLSDLHLSLCSGSSLLERQSKFLCTFAELARRHADTRPKPRPLTRERATIKLVRDYLIEHSTENVSLDELAKLSNLSSFHLVRVFRAEVGLPPHAFLEQVRVNRARRLMQQGMTLSEVAFATGFTDQSHFTRHFKKMAGVTPGQYQKSARTYKTTPIEEAQTFRS